MRGAGITIGLAQQRGLVCACPASVGLAENIAPMVHGVFCKEAETPRPYLCRLQRGCTVAGGLTYTEAAAVADATEARADPTPQSPAPTAEAAAAAVVRAVNAVALATAAAQEEPACNICSHRAVLSRLHCQQLKCCVARIFQKQVRSIPPLQVGTAASMPSKCQSGMEPTSSLRARYVYTSPVAVDAKAAASAADTAA